MVGALALSIGATAVRAADEIFVSNYSTNAVTVYDRTANGDVPPIRTIQSGLNAPHNFDADFVHSELFVPNNQYDFQGAAIEVYDLDASFPGSDTPKRTIAGALTLLNRPAGVAVDTVNNELFVANDVSGASTITVYDLAANGNVSPLRTLSGASTGIEGPVGIAVDTVNDELYVVNYRTANGGSVEVFSRTASGNTGPLRTLQGTGTLLQDPQGMVLDLAHDEFYVANSKFSTAVGGDILVFARTASGNTAPTRSITGPTTGLCNPGGAFLDTTHDELAVANSHFGSAACVQSVTVYARTASGDAAPLRTIAGGTTAMGNPTAVVVRTPQVVTACTGAPNGSICDDGNPCTAGDTCQGGVCTSGPPVVCAPLDACHTAGVCNATTGVCSNPVISCDDHNPCTSDRCDPATGCVHTGSDGPDNSCSKLTDEDSCPLSTGMCGTGSSVPEFRLVNIQRPAFSTILNATVLNDYILNASNPGQLSYNVFFSGAPGASLSLDIQVPFPFVTQGSNPIQVFDGASVRGGCYSAGPTAGRVAVTTDGGNASPSGSPVIQLADYALQNLGGTTDVHVTGVVPPSGLAYVTIHLDYGLKKVTGWQQGKNGTSLQGPDTNLDGVLDGLGGGPIVINSPQSYGFGFSGGGAQHTSSPASCNKFNKNPGVNGSTLRSVTGDPVAGVRVQFYGPDGSLISATATDPDGYYAFPYKAKGKAADYTVKLPDYREQKTVTLKAGGYAYVLFDDLPTPVQMPTAQ
jgi:hypothetical protein